MQLTHVESCAFTPSVTLVQRRLHGPTTINCSDHRCRCSACDHKGIGCVLPQE